MMFSGKVLCPTLSLTGWQRTRARAAAALAGLALLVACGGGTTQQQTFLPDRVIAFGDEASVFTDNGRKFSVNALDANDAIDCASHRLWIQEVAASYAYVFAQCNPLGAGVVKAFTRAGPGARIDDVRVQVDAQVAAGGFTNKDLVTMLAGANDVLALYAQFPARSEESLLADARAAGDRLAAQVNRVVGLGPRVIISTVQDVGLSPYALAQKAAFTDTDRAALITRLVAALNSRLRLGIVNDGRLLGLVLADEAVQVMVRVPEGFSLTNVTAGVCTVALPDCTSKTLLANTTAAGSLWADATRLGVPGHSRLGFLAQQRALNNPF